MKYLKILFLFLVFTLINFNFGAPMSSSSAVSVNNTVNYFEDARINADANIVDLKDGKIRTRKEVYHLIQPVIEYQMKLHGYNEHFDLSDSVSYAIACIFVSESSNGKGHSARSSLWLEHNNPFGLTSTQGTTKLSWEMINGKKVVMHRTFRTFDNFEEAFNVLMTEYLFKPRYDKLLNSKTVKGFLYDLYECGYMTNRFWSSFAYNDIYLKSMFSTKED